MPSPLKKELDKLASKGWKRVTHKIYYSYDQFFALVREHGIPQEPTPIGSGR